MYRGELLFFLLAVGIFSIDFLKVRTPHFFEFTTLPPKITQWELDSCTRTISVQAVAGGIPPYDFYVFKQDVLDSSNWLGYRLIKEQLPQISGLPPGTYRVKAVNEGVTSPSSATNTLEVSFHADPEIKVNGSTSLCSGSSPAITVQLAHLEGPLPIGWTAELLQAPEDGEVLGYTSSPPVTQFKISDTLVNTGKTLANVSYQLQALVNGCFRPAGTVEVQVNPLARIEASLSDSLLCSGTPFSISLLPQSWVSSPMQVRWLAELLSGQVSELGEGGQFTLPSPTPISQNLTNQGTAPARVRYTFLPSFNGCEGVAESLEVVVLPDPQVSPLEDIAICAGERVSIPEFTFNFRGDSVRYSWIVSDSSIGLSSGTGHRIPDFQAIHSGSGSKQSLITVTPRLYSQGISCIGPSHSFSITVRAPLVIEEELSDYAGFGVSCSGATDGKIKIYLSDGILEGEEPNYTYSWSGPNGFRSTEKDLHNLVSGTYQVTVSDANGCSFLGPQLTITEPTPLVLTQSKVDNSCAQGISGSISILLTGGAGFYQYAWTGPNAFRSTKKNLHNLVSGTYQVTVTDANGCRILGPQLTITEPTPLALTQSKVDNVCFQGNTGSLTVIVSGGTAPYRYAWTGPNNFSSTVANPQNLVSGRYQVTVTDRNGCALIGVNQTINEPSPFVLTAQVQSETCADAGDGRIELTLSGGLPPYQVRWEHAVTGLVASSLGPGTYRVTVTDQGGCIQTAEYSLLPISALRLEGTLTYQATQVPLQISALLQSNTQGGTPPYTYRWNTGQNTPSLRVTQSGTYTIQLEDGKGCVQEKEFVVNLPLPLAIDLIVNTLPLCEEGGQESTLLLTIRDGLAPYQVTWAMGSVRATGMQFTTRESGLVEVQVKDALGLIQKRAINIAPRLSGLLDFDYLFESQPQFQADLVDFKGVFRSLATWPHLVISWDFGDGISSSQASPTHTYTRKGRYTVTLKVLDESGCLIIHSKVVDILDYFIEIPNVFTPNGDHLNDNFFPKFRFITHLQLQVMNKWGELIYRSRGVDDLGWDGTIAGQKAPEGVYVYMLSYQVPDGRVFTSSSTFLLAR